MTLIWKYLTLDAKLNCRLVCKRFNEIISGKHFLGQNVFFPSKVEEIPKLRSNHERVMIQGLNCFSLTSEEHQMLEQFRHSLIHLKLFGCSFDLMTLYQFLSELPLLETIEFVTNFLTMKTSIELTNEDLFKLLSFKDFKMEINFDLEIDILDNKRNVLNIEITSSVNKTLSINEINDSMRNHESKKSLNFIKCIANKAEGMYGKLTLHLNTNTHLSPMDITSIDYLEELDDFELYDVNNGLKNFFKTKCIDGLAGLAVNYTAEEKNMLFEEIHRQFEEKR